MNRLIATLASLLMSWGWAAGVSGRTPHAEPVQGSALTSLTHVDRFPEALIDGLQESFAHVGQVPLSELHKLDGEQVLGYVRALPQRVRIAVLDAWCAAPVCNN